MNSTGKHRPAPENHSGFTLIELMVVIAIVSILAAIAVALYGDYVTRSKVGEGMVFAAEAKTSVAEYYSNLRALPSNNSEAGLSAPTSYARYDYIQELRVGTVDGADPGTITITFDILQLGANNLLQLIPSTASGDQVTWTCIAPATFGVEDSKLPPSCRGGG